MHDPGPGGRSGDRRRGRRVVTGQDRDAEPGRDRTLRPGGGAAPGIGFAISSAMAVRIARQLVASGHVTSSGRAALGVEVATEVAPDGTPAGVGIVSVTAGGPAAKAGLRAGDLITAVNGTGTPDAQALSAVLADLRPGQAASVRVTRAGGGRATVKVTLGQLPGS
ncbi:MAG TPA: PDZ domain-containing protein [Streptosporangiaceae bacterium]|nr:PDZ domain-containing protein [Streptosporangiaceae bacterium]